MMRASIDHCASLGMADMHDTVSHRDLAVPLREVQDTRYG